MLKLFQPEIGKLKWVPSCSMGALLVDTSRLSSARAEDIRKSLEGAKINPERVKKCLEDQDSWLQTKSWKEQVFQMSK